MRVFSTLAAPLLLVAAVPSTNASNDEAHVEIEIINPIKCSRPTRIGDQISVHYKGSLQENGKEFDQSYNRGKPFTFTLGQNQVIEGWEQGLLDMCPKETRRLIIPPELGYGPRGSPPVIPGGATLVFETELMSIMGVKQEELITILAHTSTETETEEMFGIATAPPTPDQASFIEILPNPTALATPRQSLNGGTSTSSSDPERTPDQTVNQNSESTKALSADPQGQCHLLGPFALLVQAALGGVALLALVFKRWRERPKRPWKIWFFDVSKQVLGSMLLHILNLAMSMVSGAPDVVNAAKQGSELSSTTGDDGQERQPNPCSFYLLNLAIDTTVGIPILYILLQGLHGLFRRSSLANPPESIKTGNYGDPPRITWWLRQSLIYFIGLVIMKLFVFFLFAALPWLPWVGDWALRWTEGNENLQIAFVMFIFPLCMNATQYWIIDNFLMDKSRGRESREGGEYSQVRSQDDDNERYSSSPDESFVPEIGPEIHGKDGEDRSLPGLKEITPTPIGSDEESRAGSSAPTTPRRMTSFRRTYSSGRAGG